MSATETAKPEGTKIDKPAKKYRFRLMAGGYSEKVGEEVTEFIDQNGIKRQKVRAINKSWKAIGGKRPIIETNYNLAKMFNAPNAIKFQLVGSKSALTDDELEGTDAENDNETDDLTSSYDKWTIRQLRQHAKAEDIDIEGCKTKDDLIAAIRLHEEAMDHDEDDS
jgi:hypothetical protein